MREEKSEMNKRKYFIIASICLVLTLAFIMPFISSEETNEPNIVKDSLGRIILIDYDGTDSDISYSYYDVSNNTKEINIGHGKEIYDLDYNGLITREYYREKPRKTKYYTYYADDSLETITQNGVVSRYIYDYEGRVEQELTYVDGKIMPVFYKYDLEGAVIKITTLYSVIEYKYNDCGITEEKTTDSNSGGVYWVKYEYDADCNRIKWADSTGRSGSSEYEKKQYGCDKIECSNPDCTEFTSVSDTCDYYRLSSEETGDHISMPVYDSEENVIGYKSNFNNWQVYSPLEKYDTDTGELEEDDENTYEYDDQFRLVKITSKKDGSYTSIKYDKEGEEYLPSVASYFVSSDESNANTDSFLYNGLGEEVRIISNLQSQDIQTTLPIVGSFLSLISNFFSGITGLAIFDSGEEEITLYATSPGDLNSFVTEEEFDLLAKSEKAPEEYKFIMSSFKTCFDADRASGLGFEQSTFNASYILLDGIRYYDKCESESRLIEYDCNSSSGFFDNPHEYSKVDCVYGCVNGACLTEAPVEIPPEIPSVPEGEYDLPPEPTEG